MKIFKKNLIIIIAIATLLTGCVKKSEIIESIKITTDTPVSIITGGHSFSATTDVATNSGVYSVKAIGDSHNILYSDFESGKSFFLCSTPGCDHSNDNCTSYLKASGFISCSDTSLYFISDLITTSDGNDRQEIICMDLSGANRKIIVGLNSNNAYDGDHICSNDEYLFTKLKDISSNKCFLSAINIITGKITHLLEMSSGSEIVSAANNTIFLRKPVEFDKKVQYTPDKYNIIAYDISNGKSTIVYTTHELEFEVFSNGMKNPILDTAYYFDNSKMIYLNRHSKELLELDLITGNESLIIDLNNYDDMWENFSIYGANKNYVIINFFENDECITVDRLNKTYSRNSLKRFNIRYNEYERLIPSFVTNDKIVFLNGGDYYSTTFYLPNGTKEKHDIPFAFYAFISDYNFFNNEPLYNTMMLDDINYS